MSTKYRDLLVGGASLCPSSRMDLCRVEEGIISEVKSFQDIFLNLMPTSARVTHRYDFRISTRQPRLSNVAKDLSLIKRNIKSQLKNPNHVWIIQSKTIIYNIGMFDPDE